MTGGGSGMCDAGAGLIHSRTFTGITDLAGDVVVRHIYALTSDAHDLAIVAVALCRYHLYRTPIGRSARRGNLLSTVLAGRGALRRPALAQRQRDLMLSFIFTDCLGCAGRAEE
jgi:hypothetical protein